MAVESRQVGARIQRRRSYGRRGVNSSVHTKKVTVTIPEDVLEAAIEQVESGRAPSLSAYVSDALAKRVAADSDGDAYQAFLDQLAEEVGPPSEEDVAWAEEVLSRLSRPPGRSRLTPEGS